MLYVGIHIFVIFLFLNLLTRFSTYTLLGLIISKREFDVDFVFLFRLFDVLLILIFQSVFTRVSFEIDIHLEIYI